jgi:hypothetical protein
MKQPDRYRKMVEARIKKLNSEPGSIGYRCAGCLEGREIVALLRREHAAVVRLIKGLRNYWLDRPQSFGGPNQYKAEACDAILERLTQRRR